MENVTISEIPPISRDEFKELKVGFENLELENKRLIHEIEEAVELIKNDVPPDAELLKENKNLKEAYEWTYHENQELKYKLEQTQETSNKIESN